MGTPLREHGNPLHARSGWPIPVYKPLPAEGIYQNIEGMAEFYRRKFGVTVEVRSKSTHPYNCVGMVFASRRVEINDVYIKQILDEDGYREIDSSQVKLGDVVAYKNPQIPGRYTHVGVVCSINPVGSTIDIKVMSKWGTDMPEFIHSPNSVPDAYGTLISYFTERP